MKYLAAILLILCFIAAVSAQEMSASNADKSVEVSDGDVTFTTPAGILKATTNIDGEKFRPSEHEKNSEKKITYKSGEKLMFVFPDPIVQQQYEFTDKGMVKETLYLKSPKKISYTLVLPQGAYIEEIDGGEYKVINPGINEKTEGYIVIQRPFGYDNARHRISLSFAKKNENTLEIAFPKLTDDGTEIEYPILVDPILEHRYALVLLLHGNCEPPDYATNVFWDSSKYFHMPVGTGATDNPILHTTQRVFGNCSIFFNTTPRGQNLTIPDHTSFTIGSNNFSIDSRLRWVQSTQPLYLYYQVQDVNNYNSLTVSNTTLSFTARRGGVTIGSVSAPVTSPVINQWYQISLIKNDTSGQFYINGTASGSAGTFTAPLTDLSAPVIIGGHPNAATDFGGLIDEYSIFNGGTAPVIGDFVAEIPQNISSTNYYGDDNATVTLLHFNGANGGTIFNDTVRNKTWTRAGGFSTSTAWSKFGTASALAVAPGSLMTPNVPEYDFGTGGFTIEGWIKPTATTGNAVVFGAYNGSTDGYRLIYFGATRTWSLQSNSSGVFTSDMTWLSTKVDGIPYHIAATRNGTAIKLYADGVQVASATIAASAQYNSYGSTPTITGTSLNYDDIRVSNVDRYPTGFVPQSTEFGVTTPMFLISPEALGTIPATFQFTDITADSAWTQNGYVWQFGDNTTSFERNPSHTYVGTGIWNVTLSTYNGNSTESITRSLLVGAPVVDFSATPLTGTAALHVIFTAMVTNDTPISSWFLDFGDGTFTTEAPVDGTWSHVYATYGSFSPNLTATNSIGTGYEYKRDYIIVSTPQQTFQTVYTPHQVRIEIVDFYGKPLPGTNITAYYIASSLPNTSISWITSAYGVQTEVAAEMVNSGLAMRGLADSSGGVTFTMFESLQYQLVFTNTTSGVLANETLFPIDREYLIHVPTNGQAPNVNTLEQRNMTLPWYSNNNTHLTVAMQYRDTGSTTSAVKFRVYFRDNGTEVHNTTWTAIGTGLILDNHTLRKAPIGTEYIWEANATVTGGKVVQANSLMTHSPLGLLIPLGIENFVPAAEAIMYYGYISVFMILVLASFSGMANESRFLVMVPFLAAGLVFIGWLQAPNATSYWGTVIMCCLFGTLIFVNDMNREKHGSAGPGNKAIAIALMIIVFEASVVLMSNPVMSPFPNLAPMGNGQASLTCSGYGYTCDANGQIDLSASVSTVNTAGGTLGGVASLATWALEMAFAMIWFIIKVVAAVLLFSAVILAAYPVLQSSPGAILILGIMQLVIWAIYMIAWINWTGKLGPDSVVI